MIKIEETEIYGWKAAIRGMRNPKNSWDKRVIAIIELFFVLSVMIAKVLKIINGKTAIIVQ